MSLVRDQPTTFDAAPYFSDPDGDALTYSVTSNDPLTVGVSVTGSRVTLTPLRDGTVTVTLTARDPGGLSASQTFTVTVGTGNRPPMAVGSIPDQRMTLGGNPTTLDVAGNFTDPDGDDLTLQATSTDSGIVRAVVSETDLILIPVVDGTATVTVTATDPGGLSATQTFEVTVGTQNHSPTVAAEIPDQTLSSGGSAVPIGLAAVFSDPDGDELTFEATSTDSGIVRAVVSETDLILIPVADGAATVTVTATDPGGLSATQTFEVTVGTQNRSPTVAAEIPDQILDTEGNAVTLDLSSHFTDPDGDSLAYTATSSSSGVVRAIVSENDLLLIPGFIGTARIRVVASDSHGLSAELDFSVIVSDVSGTMPATPVGLRVEDVGTEFIVWTWDAVEDALGYEVQLSPDDVFTTEDDIVSVDETFYRAEGLEPGTFGYLRVRAVGGSRQDPIRSAWSTHATGMTTGPVEGVDDHGNTPGTATRIDVPSITAGELETAGDVDYFRVSIEENGRLTAYTVGSTDTTGRLFTGSRQIASNDDGGSGSNFSIAVNVTPGTHYIAVQGYNNTRTGPYTLHTMFEPTGSQPQSAKQVTVSIVVFDPEEYEVTGNIQNTGNETIDRLTSWVRFYRSDGTLVVEDDDPRFDELSPGSRAEFEVDFISPHAWGWDYFLVSFVDRRDRSEINCIGCSMRHVPPPHGPCGSRFDEAIAVTKQNSRGKWWAAGPIQTLILWDQDSEREALDYVVSEVRWGIRSQLERIGTADYRRVNEIERNVRLYRAGYPLVGGDYDQRNRLLNVRCLP